MQKIGGAGTQKFITAVEWNSKMDAKAMDVFVSMPIPYDCGICLYQLVSIARTDIACNESRHCDTTHRCDNFFSMNSS